MQQIKKAGAVVVLIFHILFCVYGSMLCLYRCSSFINGVIWNIHWLWATFFKPDETMIWYVVFPLWFFGVISSLIIIVTRIRNRNTVYVITVCVTLAVTFFLTFFVLSAPIDRFPRIVHDLICWASAGWYLFDVIYVIRYYIIKDRNSTI